MHCERLTWSLSHASQQAELAWKQLTPGVTATAEISLRGEEKRGEEEAQTPVIDRAGGYVTSFFPVLYAEHTPTRSVPKSSPNPDRIYCH